MREFFKNNPTATFTLLSSIVTLVIGFIFTFISNLVKNKQDLKVKIDFK